MLKLYHTGRMEIKAPDIYKGRQNADFGRGFYLSPDMDFTYRWAYKDAIVNIYELDEEGLKIHRFRRDEDWFRYIFNNRRFKDNLDADVVIGPIANDTIFDTFGIISSGYLEPAEALKLLMIGPEYTQAAIKTEKAVKQLHWMGSEKITKLESDLLKAEQEAYATAFAKAMEEMEGEE